MATVNEVHADATGLWHATVTADSRAEAIRTARAGILTALVEREQKSNETERQAEKRLRNYLRVAVRRTGPCMWRAWEV